jgi:hypothetical protein
MEELVMADLLQHKPAFFDKFPNQPLEFIVVTDINMIETPYNYKGIFKNIKTGKFHSYEVAPEMMRYKYKIGHIYTNGEHVGENKSLLKGEFHVNDNYAQSLVEISTVLTENDIELISYSEVKKYYLRQFAHVERHDDCTLIIPCYAIANRFYFLSSAFKNAAMRGVLADLYYEGSFNIEAKEDRSFLARFHAKKKANKKDIPFIARFAGSSYAQSRFKYLTSQRNKDKPFQQIKAQFPVKNSFDIYASYVCVGNDERGLSKYVVLNIHSDNSYLGFEELHYKQYSEKQDPKTVEPKQLNIKKNSKKRIKKVKATRDNKIYEGTPSNDYLLYTLYTRSDDEYYRNNVKVVSETIYQGNEAEIVYTKSDKQIGNSLKDASNDGDEDLGQVHVANGEPEENNAQNEIFNLQDFYQFYEGLLTYAGVDGEQLVGPFDIKAIYNKNRKSIKSKAILYGKQDKPRKFLFGLLNYNNKDVYIVEIEQDKAWGPSTWMFIAEESTEIYTSDEMKDLIEYYIENEPTYKKFEEYVFNQYGLLFDHKDHKKGDVGDEEIEGWCELVIARILRVK